ncbi:Chitin biosynthesis protein CHS5 [Nakaseomyces glabratus]|uniref:Chitin biosynthesis protein CHS5 n=1 Tax=Candida glabrata TaxID=5478 RepID=A0A0W0C702_CANGB|nr:Chitin biosynthesis protein CHS5 [Nakaseomyces glabratus]KTB07727.1 Chitin biosynthesis protein CHS5 [Nakaseomyces glabratus]KTB08439.1 Chitin biosynthesis protein CHS5 [Nakaseomyces glabratus]KTB21467.1 Chitin biosynthesis protein CHS5 [Nakaseomyces glabratus]
MSAVEVLLTVGKMDASLALLTTKDHHVIELPTMLLPENVKAGSIVKMQVVQDVNEEEKERSNFKNVQAAILEKYGSSRPSAPILKVINVTQTGCILAWDHLQLGSAKLKSLVLYRQGVRSMVIPNPFKVTTTKISGLSIDSVYEFQLKLSTTSGQFWSEKVKIHTHKMTDMSGITVCLGPLDPLQKVTPRQIAHSLKTLGARPLQDHVAIDTTHFVCNDIENDDDPELLKAKNNNIPIVRPEWIRACEVEKRIVGVRGFYLDADPSILSNYGFPELTDEQLQEKEVPALPNEESEAQFVKDKLDQVADESVKDASTEAVSENNDDETKKEQVKELETDSQDNIEEPIQEESKDVPEGEPHDEFKNEGTEELSEVKDSIEQEIMADEKLVEEQPKPAEGVQVTEDVAPEEVSYVTEDVAKPAEEVTAGEEVNQPAEEVNAATEEVAEPEEEVAEPVEEAEPNEEVAEPDEEAGPGREVTTEEAELAEEATEPAEETEPAKEVITEEAEPAKEVTAEEAEPAEETEPAEEGNASAEEVTVSETKADEDEEPEEVGSTNEDKTQVPVIEVQDETPSPSPSPAPAGKKKNKKKKKGKRK